MIKINGTQLPIPYKFDPSLADLDASAERTASGLLVRDRVRSNIYKLALGFRGLTKSEYSSLIRLISNASFQITFPDPVTGVNKTITAYAGDKKLTSYKWDITTNTVYYTSLDFNVIQY